MKYKELLKKLAAKAGSEIGTYRPFLELIGEKGASVVFDVGANTGQYATKLREAGYTGAIVSFEPVSACARSLQQKALADPNWKIVPKGLGRESSEATIHIPADTRLSSILAPRAFEGETRTETIHLLSLSEAMASCAARDDAVFVKLDTQGYELEILRGGESVLDRVLGFQIELSVSALYEGQPPFEEVVSWLRARGFVLWVTRRGLYDPGQQRELEFDGLFFRG